MNNEMENHKQIVMFLLLFVTSYLPLLSKNETSAVDELIKRTLGAAQKAEAEQNAPLAANAYAKVIMLTRRQCRNKQKNLPRLLFSYGQMLTYAGDYEDAVPPLDEALRRSQAAGDKETEARTLTQMGIINFFLSDWDRALSFYRQAEVLAKEIDNRQGLSIIVNDIANIYQKKHNYRQAIAGYQETLKMQRELNDSATICNTLFNIGTCHEEQHDVEAAQPYYRQAYRIASAIKDAEIYSLSAAHIAKNLMKNGRTAEAMRLFKMAEDLTRASQYKAVRAEVYQVRSMALEQMGDCHGALAYYKKMKLLTDSLQKEDTKKQIEELQIKYKTAERERLVERQQEELQQKNVLQYVLAGGIAVCLVVLFIVNRYRRLVRRRNHELREMNNVKDKFFSVISHDLKNPVLAQKNSLTAIVERFGNMTSDDIHGICIELLDSSKSLLDLLYNLLSWSRLQTGRIIYNPTVFPLVDVARDMADLISVQLKEKSLSLNIAIPDDAMVTADRNMISTMVRNLVSNAIKFSYQNGRIDLSAEKTDSRWLVSITDYGIGMTPEVQSSLFRLNVSKSMLGTNGETGSGLGLVVCREIIEHHGSRIQVKSEKGKGSTFSFTLQEG